MRNRILQVASAGIRNLTLNGLEVFVLLLSTVLLFGLLFYLYQRTYHNRHPNLNAVDFIDPVIRKEKLNQSYEAMVETHNRLLYHEGNLEHQYQVFELAYYDMLTKLPNRYFFEERIKEKLNTNSKASFALLFMDVDNLKAINDSLGYAEGDKALLMITDTLLQFVDDEKELYKFGGDEFILLLNDPKGREALEHYLKTLLKQFQKPFELKGLGFSLTLSIGVASYPEDGLHMDLLLKHADIALNHIKQKGKNGYEIFSYALNETLNERFQLERSLRKAIVNQEFVLYYQPKYALENKKIVGFEALIRWEHPKRGMMSPIQFIPVAEETGLIIPIGEWVLHEAMHQLKAWHESGYTDLSMAINLSTRQLKDINLVTFIKQLLQKTHVPPSAIELEITESAALYDVNYAISVLDALKVLGIKVSLDDFGTGYSSLNYLTRLPIDTLKIDKSFLANAHDHSNVEIIRSVIALAHACDMDVVAEGVETDQQMAFLVTESCDLVQGFLFSQPLPADQAIKLIVI